MRRGIEDRKLRQETVEKLKEERSQRTIGEQLSEISKRSGESAKEVKRLLALIKKEET
jgi:hypothetical protein